MGQRIAASIFFVLISSIVLADEVINPFGVFVGKYTESRCRRIGFGANFEVECTDYKFGKGISVSSSDALEILKYKPHYFDDMILEYGQSKNCKFKSFEKNNQIGAYVRCRFSIGGQICNGLRPIREEYIKIYYGNNMDNDLAPKGLVFQTGSRDIYCGDTFDQWMDFYSLLKRVE